MYNICKRGNINLEWLFFKKGKLLLIVSKHSILFWRDMMNQEVNNEKLKNKLKNILIFILFEMIFTMITFIPYCLYGPFKHVRNTIISTVMSTGSHQYIARWFFSEDKIKNIIKEENQAENTSSNYGKDDIAKVTYNNDGIGKINLRTSEYNGIAILIKDPKRVKIGFAKKIGHVGDTTHEIAKRYNAVAAVNGGYYEDTSGNGTGAIPWGFIISDGKIVYNSDKNKLDKKIPDVMTIDGEGKLSVGGTYSPKELIKMGIKEALVTAPYLIKDGKDYIEENTVSGLNPRTAIGQTRDNHIVLLVIDGRQGITKFGASLKDVQNIMHEFGVVNAVCLDGGGSSTMYYNGRTINNPSSATGERAVPDILYVEP